MEKIFLLIQLIRLFLNHVYVVTEPRDRSRAERNVGRKPHCFRATPSGDRQARAKAQSKARKQRKEVRLMKAYN